MRKRWLAAAILMHLAIIPFFGTRANGRGVSNIPAAPARRREPMPVRPSMPNRFRVSPIPGPLQT